MRRTTPLLLLPALLSACGPFSSGTSAPVLGSTRQAVSKAWPSAEQKTPCIQENLALTCQFLDQGTVVKVTFDQTGRAEQFQTPAKTAAHVNTWRLLTAMVPTGSKLASCRSVPKSSGGGTAHACIYRGQRDIIVAYFPHPEQDDYGGLVTYDFDEYKDIQNASSS